ncbi:glycoside hydrolase family 9 protein [Lacticaseibacillus kribbianus]|uniref:glycoside hydrolase family 9 protein n=1 Tax=Lacticaseibacillus kribbianus TaxID=2926292 RepID=UPI001CD48290|nr:glycoside hydrolase family 9 protein [Lacticaseibacillus kribbianus]
MNERDRADLLKGQPLTLDTTESLEAALAAQPVLASHACAIQDWHKSGRGAFTQDADTLTITTPTRFATWDPGAPSDGDYVSFGSTKVSGRPADSDWTAYTRLSFDITADCTHVLKPNITLSLTNDGVEKVPDAYGREGVHAIHLINGVTSHVILTIDQMPRDNVTAIAFTVEADGSLYNLPGTQRFSVQHLRLEKAEVTLTSRGWAASDLVYSHDGYLADGSKRVIASGAAPKAFTLVDAAGAVVYEGQGAVVTAATGTFTTYDFDAFTTPGTYTLVAGDRKTRPFRLGTALALWGDSAQKALNFIYSERCGYPVPGIHGTCHQDVTAEFRGRRIAFCGGWHDAGDLSQQTVQTAEVAAALFQYAQVIADTDPDLAYRLRREGRWGVDFVLRMRLEDGYHVTSAGLNRWTDNQIGTMDDVAARVHNNSLESFLIGGALADVALSLPDDDPAYKAALTEVAVAEYEAGRLDYADHPFKAEPVFWEHTYNTPRSTYDAAVARFSALLYKLTGEAKYAARAADFLNQMLSAQEQDGIALFDGRTLKGMFYRNNQHRVFTHFNHQSREQLYGQALATVITLVPDSDSQPYWRRCANAYADYLTYLADACAPYPMLASGVYGDLEYLDEASFAHQHLLIDAAAKDEFSAQLKAGTEIAPGLYLKRFPVWFSFRGNTAVLLSAAIGAAALAPVLHRPRLAQLAQDQLQWLIGENPFGQSLMYGEGHRFAALNSVLSGEIVGGLPVGIETKDNEDVPYWPQANNATYKEVWIGAVGKWLSVLATLGKEPGDDD